MPEHKRDTRAMLRAIHRDMVENNLGIALLLNHYGLPQVSQEQIEKALAEEDVTRPVKSPTVTAGHLSTCDPAVHSRTRVAHPIRDGEPR